jgi:subtilisin family serine protease
MNNAQLHLRSFVQTAPMAEQGKIGLVTAETDLDPDMAVQVLSHDPAIDHVEKNGAIYGMATPNDPLYLDGSLWNMYSGTSTPPNAYGTHAADAWAAGYVGSNSVYVAILDGGIEITHPDLGANIWTNTFETADSTDNDNNGYVDDLHGWNFYDTNNVVTLPSGSTDGHGTILAGIIGAMGGNNAGVVGINWNVTMIPAKILQDGEGAISDAIVAIDYCIDLKQRHGLNLVAINASWGTTEYSQLLHEAVIRAANAGILFIAAAGNAEDGTSAADNDTTPFWPANIDTTVAPAEGETPASYDSVISVAAIDDAGNLAAFSNYGASTVHIGAPGVDIVSTYLTGPEGDYALTSGTSLATPHVTGAVALYASTHPGASAQQIRSAILGSVIATPSLSGKTTTGGRLNLTSVILPGTIAGRHIFYNQSAWDGNSAAANASDDNAIATDKSALLPGGTATFANYTSYSRGINGIMVDIANIGDASSISASDFTFKVGNNNTPSGWATAPTPSSVTVRQGAGTGGSTRITIIWANNAIQKQWLQVTVLSTKNTGLASSDTFYFGNAIGETGNIPGNTNVDAADQILTRTNFRGLSPAPIDFRYDYNRDKKVDAADQIIQQNNFSGLKSLKLISL